jgi:uncharacterized protein
MKKQIGNLLNLLVIVLLIVACNPPNKPTIMTDGPEVVEFRALPFSLSDVKLLDGPFLKATELNKSILLNYEPDRLLAGFRTEAGLEQRAPHYEGWESNTIAGHSLGHHLTACALMYASTGDSRFLDRANYMVEELRTAQDADGSGYIGAIPGGKKIFEEEIAKGNIRSAGFDLNGLWAPWYTHHKVLSGLLDAYTLCDNEKALEVGRKFAGWMETIVVDLPDSSVQKMLHCEHGGMNEALANLYSLTGEEKFLKLARVFHHNAILDPLAEGQDILPGKHANTQIPKLIGMARLYELTGNPSDYNAASFFWKTVVNDHSYVTGGHCNNEYFGEPRKLRDRLGPNTTETCNVYNMLKLSEHLFALEASPEVADFYERALLNHIHSSQHPHDGRVIYNLSIDMGGRKEYQDPFWFTCCIGSGMETHSKYGLNIYYHNSEELFVSQFVASELNWKEKGMTIRQITGYPEEQKTRLEFTCEKPVKLTLQLRYPYWAEKGMEITINGKSQKINSLPGSFVSLSRTWKTGDVAEIQFPFSLRLETMPDDTNRVAVMYGPLVLAGDLGPENDPGVQDPLYVPVLMTKERDPLKWLAPVEGETNQFFTRDVGRPRDVMLKPFYAFHDRRYSIYFDMFSEEEWTARESEYRANLEKKKQQEALTIDFVQPGEMQPERDHNFAGERTTAGSFKERPNRESRSGWFSYDLKVEPDIPVVLVVEYWGGFPGGKTFDIIIDGQKIATENISGIKDGQFIFIEYPIPTELTKGKRKTTIKFSAHPQNMAGPVFGIRTIRAI